MSSFCCKFLLKLYRYLTDEPVMNVFILRTVPVVVLPLGHYQSLPAQIGTACPLDDVVTNEPKEHPQLMTFAGDINFQQLEPVNCSTLGSEPHL